MRSDLPLLASLEIAAPCPASWATMNGGDTQRFCDSCRLHVHDLSAMTAQEAETLLQTHQGELCVRYTQDSDGRILTDEFPSLLRPMRSLILKHCAMVAAFVLLALTTGVHQASAETTPAKAKTVAAKRVVKKAAQSVRVVSRPTLGLVAVARPQVEQTAPRRLGRVRVQPAPPANNTTPPNRGKRVMPVLRLQPPKADLTLLMGEPVVNPAIVLSSSPALSGLNSQIYLGYVASPAEIQKAQEGNAVKAQEKASPKPLDSPKP